MFSNLRQLLSGSGDKKTFKQSEQMRKKIRNFFFTAILRSLKAKVVKYETTSFHYFSPYPEASLLEEVGSLQ